MGYSEAVFNWVNLLAYVDLNPIRAGIVKRPEDYKWCSLGYHIQTKNKDDLLCVDYGMKEWNEFESREIVRNYREFIYETGAVDAGKGATIDPKIVDRERKRKYKVSRVDRFRYRPRYFSPSETTQKEFLRSRVSPGKPTPGSSVPRPLWGRPQ